MWPTSQTSGAPNNAGVKDMWNNDLCTSKNWPVAVLRNPVTLPRLPGILVAPMEVTIGESSLDGVIGYGAKFTLRLDTPPSNADVTITLIAANDQQVIFSNSTVTFKLGDSTWDDGIRVSISAYQDNTPEASKGESHATSITFNIVNTNDVQNLDNVYNPQFVTKYGIDVVPTVSVAIFDPLPNTIAPPQITEVRFHTSLTYLILTFDSDTNGAVGSTVECDTILVLPTKNELGATILGDLNERRCSWSNAREFRMYLGYGATVRANTRLTVKDLTVYGACKVFNPTTGECDNFRLPLSGGFSPVQLPAPQKGRDTFTLYPTLIASYSPKIGLCDDLFVDISASKGSGPFPWELLSFITLECQGIENTFDCDSNPLAANVTIDQTKLSVAVPRSNFPNGFGSYVFRASLRNALNEVDYQDLTVSLVADAQPRFVLAGSNARKILRTQTSTITVKKAELPCGGLGGALKITWTSLSGTKNNDVATLHVVPISTRDPNRVSIKGSVLKSGYIYSITGMASLAGYASVATSSTVSLEVLYSPLVAVLTPPGIRTVGVEDNVILDGTKSYDPDDDGTISYSWLCTNCPAEVNNLLATGASKITINKGLLSQGTTYSFSLSTSIVGQPSRGTSTLVYGGIEVQSGDPPDVSLTPPSAKYPNTNQPIVIEARVYSCCKLADYSCKEYSAIWSGTGLLESDTDVVTSLLSDVITAKPGIFLNDPNKVVDTDQTSGFRMYKIIVAPDMLSPGGEYSFTLNVVDACGTSKSILPTIRTNAPPSGGSIIVEGIEGQVPSSGWSITSTSATKFFMNAPGWSDPEASAGVESPLTYTFVYLEDPTNEQSKQVRMFTGTEISTYSTLLPIGHGDEGLFKIAVLIEDEDGGKTISSWSSLYVTSEPLPEDTAKQEAIFDNLISTNLEGAQNRSQSQEVLAAANMISSAMESGSVDEEVKKRVATKLVDMALEASETMATDVDSVDMQAQFVGTIAASTELNEETQNKVLDMTVSLAAASESNGAMSQDTQNALTATLSTFMLSANAVPKKTTDTTNTNDDTTTNNDGTTQDATVAKPVVVAVVNVERVQKLQNAATSVMSAIATSLVSGSAPVAIATAAFVATLESASPSAMVEKPIESSTGLEIKVSAGTFGNVTSGSDVQSLVVEFKDPPTLDNGTTTMGANGVRVVFKADGKELKVSGLKEPNTIKIPLTVQPTWIRNAAEKRRQRMLSGNANDTVVPVLCEYKGQNHQISNCSSNLDLSFNYTCSSIRVSTIPFDLICPELQPIPECVYWNVATTSWEQDGVVTRINNITGEVTCESDHLTDFSVKMVSSFQAVDDILASPFNEKVANPEELMALLLHNIVVILTMMITMGIFVVSCCMSHHFDSQDQFAVKRKKLHHVKNVWSASRGILSWKQLEQNVLTTPWYELWWEGIKCYHPLMSIYFTHSMAITRPQRVMILMVTITTNMFVDAMFWRARYPPCEDEGGSILNATMNMNMTMNATSTSVSETVCTGGADAKPEFLDVLLFGVIAAAMNIPVVYVFEELYKRVGAAVVASEKRRLMGKSILKGDAGAAAQRLSLHVRTVEDAELHLKVVHGAVMHTNEMLENQKTRHALMKPGTGMEKMSRLELQDYKERNDDMVKQYDRAEALLKQKKIELHEADMRKLQLVRMRHEQELYGNQFVHDEASREVEEAAQQSEQSEQTVPENNNLFNISSTVRRKSALVSLMQQPDFDSLKNFAETPSSPQEKKNKIPSKYAVEDDISKEEKPTKQKKPKSTHQYSSTTDPKKNTAKFCAGCRVWWRMLSESQKLQDEKRRSKMSPTEILIEEKLKEKNFIVQQLYDINKEQRDPGFELPPIPFWARNLMDLVAFSLVLFFCYFIVAFGFYYGQDVAVSWLQAFCLSILTNFLFATPIGVYLRVVVLPRFVAWAVFQGDPELHSIGGTPLMSGAVGSLGPTGQAAYSLGLASVAAVGATGFAAHKWRKKHKEKERLRFLKAKVRYVADPSDPYKVKMVLEKKYSNIGARQKRRSSVTPEFDLGESGIGGGVHGASALEIQSAVLNREQRLQDKIMLGRKPVQMQEQLAAQQIEDISEEVMMNAVMQLLLSGDIALDAEKELQNKIHNLDGEKIDINRKITHEVSNALPGANEAILAMVLEMLTEETLSTLTGGKHEPMNRRVDQVVKEQAGSLAEFYLLMGLNRRNDNINAQATDEHNRVENVRKDHEREQRQQRRANIVGDRGAQRQMLKKKGGGNFGTGPREERPSPILDRARARLLNDMKNEEEQEDSPLRAKEQTVLERMIDPSKSPFAISMTLEETSELRKQLPGSGRKSISAGSNGNGINSTKKEKDPLEMEVKAVQNANRDARLAALSMLNE